MFFALGFRPFFLLAGILATALLATWTAVYSGVLSFTTYYGLIGWHSHEMVFGYTVAVIAGFLLTAAGNWAGRPTLAGKPLAALALLWLAGRAAPLLPVAPTLVAAVDLAFIPALAAAVLVPLVKARQTRNLVFPLLVLLFLPANALIHLQALGITATTARVGGYLAVNLVLVLIVVMGGRVIPFFTERGVQVSLPARPWLDRVAIGAVAALAGAGLFGLGTAPVGALAAVAAVANAARLWGWHTPKIWSVPLLWVLHLGYAWLVLGFALAAASALLPISPFVFLHALTVGGIGSVTLGMMARVTVGHTGRPLRTGRWTVAAFVLIQAAALVRVFGPLFLSGVYPVVVAISGVLWVGAFGLFVGVYGPMLALPRVDGRSG